MTTFLIACLAVYSTTFVITHAKVTDPIRSGIRRLRELVGLDYRWEECRLCVGFWVSLLVWGVLVMSPEHLTDIPNWFHHPLTVLAIYGGSYFLVTQERLS